MWIVYDLPSFVSEDEDEVHVEEEESFKKIVLTLGFANNVGV